MGLKPEDFAAAAPPPAFDADTARAVSVFTALGTQWRVAFGGPIGLDYGVIPSTLRLLGHPRADWPDLFDDLRVLESAALKTMRT